MDETSVLYFVGIIIGIYFLTYHIGKIANRRKRLWAMVGALMLPIVAAIIFYLSLVWGVWWDPDFSFWGGLMLLLLMVSVAIVPIWALMALGYWAGRKL
ncbi:hypothetical protein [Flavisphingomonas formosensis]|uniref:hypothetical protein n=1 Tax=Flavisphingomonas formosensis TaxID=861534 RepID=UPI0012F730CE|nr:hypothetical protein [Sphingomonas formosensis]